MKKSAYRPVRFSRADGHWRELIDRNSREVVYIINERIYHLYLRELIVLLQPTYCMNGSSGDSPLDPAEPGSRKRRLRFSGRYQIIVCLRLILELMIRTPFPRSMMRRILKLAAQMPCTGCPPLSWTDLIDFSPDRPNWGSEISVT